MNTDVDTATPAMEDDPLKELPNPFYGYGRHEQEHTIGSGTYCEVDTPLKEVANPTYDGMTVGEKSADKDLVSNPLYTANADQGGVILSSSGLYSEVPASSEACIYDAPDN